MSVARTRIAMKTRLFKNWVTTIFGVLLFVLGCFLVYKQIIGWEAFIASIPTVLILFRAKDSLLWGKAKE